MSDQFFYVQLKFTPKIGHTFADEREACLGFVGGKVEGWAELAHSLVNVKEFIYVP